MITSNIKKIMEEKKFTVRAMNAATGLSLETINRARRPGINQCRLCTLEVIADFLECKVKDLFEES